MKNKHNLTELMEEEYVLRIHKNRTTIFQLVKLLILGRISWKYLIEFIRTFPIEIYVYNTDEMDVSSEELLFSNSGLKLISENMFTTWDGFIIAYESNKTKYIKKLKL